MILSCNNITKSFDGNTILNNCSFNVDDNEKVAIVGINGAGKSTFFKIITKQLSADNGVVTLAKDKVMSYLSQHPDMNSNRTIYEEMLDAKKDIIETENTLREMESRMSSETGDTLNKTLESYTSLSHQFEIDGGLTYKSEINGVLKGLGFTEDDYDRNISSLSGGQKTRVYLSKILLSSPDIILLDEPTNHLDLNSIVWLEQFLSNYKGAVVIISHDRYFLDKIVTKVVDIENTVCSVYSGNFSEYSKKKALPCFKKVRECFFICQILFFHNSDDWHSLSKFIPCLILINTYLSCYFTLWNLNFFVIIVVFSFIIG